MPGFNEHTLHPFVTDNVINQWIVPSPCQKHPDCLRSKEQPVTNFAGFRQISAEDFQSSSAIVRASEGGRRGEQFDDHLLHFSADVKFESIPKMGTLINPCGLVAKHTRSIRDRLKSSARFSNIHATWSEVRCQRATRLGPQRPINVHPVGQGLHRYAGDVLQSRCCC